MPSQHSDRSHESIINDALATLFRDKAGLKASAETIRPGVRPDIVVRTADGPVVVEVELEPARTLEADALSRLGMEIDGLKVQIAFAVAIPELIRTVPQEHLQVRLASVNMRWREWRSDGTSGPKIIDSFSSLARSVENAVAPASDLDEAVTILDEGARRAGSNIYRSPGTSARVAGVFGSLPGEEPANMGALIIINAMMFQERLANINPNVYPIEKTRDHDHISKILLTQSWDMILGIDYWPIFKMAREVVGNISDVEVSLVLDECAKTAEKLLSMATVGRHDLAGRIFNRLVSDRKFLAAFYTSIPAATLLAGLSLSADAWPDISWGDVNQLQNFRIIDPSCGTGTLLMASYRQIIDNHSAAIGGLDSGDELHKALIEQIICGADVVQAAIHVTAATLAAMSPAIQFSQMNLHTLKIGLDQAGKVSLGSLDWLIAPQLQSFFSTTSEQIGATNGITGMLVPRPMVDLVISNPPYTRRGSDSGHEEAIARIFSLTEGDKKAQEKIAKRTSELLRGSAANQMAGHASSFTVLADRLVKPGGRIALVLPITALAGDSWSDIRMMLSSHYNIEFVVSSHDPKLRSMSYDTDIAEILLVARRLKEGEPSTKRGIFVNLWRAPFQVTDSLALINAITATVQGALHRSDGPPVGGVPLIIGGEQWGEIVDAPVSNQPWSGARWKRAIVAQYVSALRRGELWSSDGTHLQSKIKMKRIGDVFTIGPSHRQIRGDLGPFEAYHGFDPMAQFPAIWSQEESQQKCLEASPNAYLIPKPGQNYLKVWAASGRLHFNPDIRYNSQRLNAVRTTTKCLGLSAWFTLNIKKDEIEISKKEIACLLWTNSTFGLILHADSTQQAQQGRGRGSSEMLESLLIPDVSTFERWQLEAAETIYRDFVDREFESFHKCAIDKSRIELDERVIGQMLGLPDDVNQTAKRLRLLLANEPSIYGGKDPVLPVDQ